GRCSPPSSRHLGSGGRRGGAYRPAREHELELAVAVLHDRAAVLYPVAAIRVEDASDLAKGRAVDVPADDAGEAATGGLLRAGGFEGGDELYDRLQSVLQIAGQAPVPEPEQATAAVEPPVQGQERGTADAAEPHGPAVAAGHAIEVVAVEDQQQPSVGRSMHRFARDHDVAELQIAEAAEVLVVVARDQRHDRPGVRLRQHRTDDVAVQLRPVRLVPKAPEVDDVADEIEVVAVMVLEKRQERLGVALPSAQVNVADPDRPVAHGHLSLW